MKRRIYRRGLSPVIASVLLILLVLVLAMMVFLWARGFVTEQVEKFGAPIEEYCSNVNFKVSYYSESGIDKLEIANKGNIDIFYLEIKKFKQGNSEVSRFDVPIDARQVITEEVSLEMKNGDFPEEITLYPALVGNVRNKQTNKVFTCHEQGHSLEVL
jgi:flagellin-like protein